MTDTKYNGWANYATWRVNLEIFDGIDWADYFGEDEDIITMDISDMADRLKDMAEEAITNYGMLDENSLAVSYAMSFLGEVDYYEIAEHIIEDCKAEKEYRNSK